MAQHDYVIANGTGAAVRSDLNNALAAIVSQNSGATEPATTYAFQFWADTTTGTLKLRNSANSAWIELLQLDGTLTMEDGTEALPGLSFRNDLDTGLWRPGTNQLAISTNAVERVEFGASEVVFNDGGANYDFRVEGDTNANLLFVDASADAVGIGTSSFNTGLLLQTAGGTSNGIGFLTSGTASVVWRYVQQGANDGSAGIMHGSSSARDFYIKSDGGGSANLLVDGKVGIGTASPSSSWTQTNQSTATIGAGIALFDSAGANKGQIGLAGAGTGADSSRLWLNGKTDVLFNIDGTEAARIDSSRRLLVGTSSVITNNWGGTAGLLQVAQNNFLPVGLFSYTSTGGDAYCPYFELHRARGSQASPTAVINNDELGQINFYGHDGSTFIRGAAIRSYVDGTPGTNDMPGRLVFSTTADGASSPTERMRIASNGSVRINATGNLISGNERLTVDGILTVSNGGDTPFFLQRNTNDGTLISFYQDGTAEGSISVSGTTVSYNGAHLSRWSQLPAGQEREEILRGTVLSNIDEMCEWGEEDNEQLNRMKVSDVEGDKNVSGVFQAWDDDDDTYENDFYCAMTGDFIIRIGAGVTIERGDLLMSAGDGTAKPQDDDIIRSKTIAKVTSTNVSCTYDDGSYCVPCVLMAC